MDDMIISEIIKLNKEGKCTHYKDSSGYECWRDYDNNGNLVHLKNSKDYEVWWEFDENNDLIYSKHVNGIMVAEYERSSVSGLYNKTHWINTYGDEYWQKWDDANRLMLSSSSTGDLDVWFKYDDEREFTEIEEEEYKQIKKDGKEREFLSREEVPRFNLMEVKNETISRNTGSEESS